MINIHTRRSFLEKCALAGATMGLASLVNTPLFLRRALAEGTIGQGSPKKKLLFVFLRGGQDALNTCIPILDNSYSEQRSSLYIPRTGQTSATDNTTGLADYNLAGAYNSMPGTYAGNKMFDATVYGDLAGTPRLPSDPVFKLVHAIPAGNGFAALHPSMKFLAPVFNDGDLAIIHRVGYPSLTRSHFDSQIYWENGKPGDNSFRSGIFYRAMEEAAVNDPSGVGLQALTGVSFQTALPLLLRGAKVPMTNMEDTGRFSLQSIPGGGQIGIGNTVGNESAWATMSTNGLSIMANNFRRPDKGDNRAGLALQFENIPRVLNTFAAIDFSDTGANIYKDPVVTDGDTVHSASYGYNLFPVSNATNGGYTAHGNDADKQVIPDTQYDFMRNVKAAALVLGKSEALIAGTELGGWDTHSTQVSDSSNPNSANPSDPGRHTGNHANLVRTIGWTVYALRRFFSNPTWSPNCSWNDVVVMFVTEFGRASAQNNNLGTDHGESSVMLVAGGNVNGKVYCANTTGETYNGRNCNWTLGTGGQNGTMFGAYGRYLDRRVDYRSVLGEIIRDHLGANDSSASAQLGRIIPGYAGSERNHLKTGGSSPIDGRTAGGELGII